MTAYQLFNITPSETQFFPSVHHSNVAKCSQLMQLSAIWLSYKQLEKMAIRANCPFPCLQPRATVLDITLLTSVIDCIRLFSYVAMAQEEQFRTKELNKYDA